MGRFDWLALVAIVVLVIAGPLFNMDESVPDTDNPRRPEARHFKPLYWDDETRAWMASGPQRKANEIPDSAPVPLETHIDGRVKKTSSTGSAFSVSRDGHWLTARHVVEGCNKTYIQIAEKSVLAARKVVIHPRADVAVITTKSGPQPFAVAASTRRVQDAYNFGFPAGRPGAVHARYLGQTTVTHRGRGGYRERVHAWTERSRVPGRFGSLGGLSGGLVLGDDGRAIGVVQSESRRRGRIMTAKPETLRQILTQASVNLPATAERVPAANLTATKYPAVARRLITTLRVARVLCLIN